MFSIYQTFHPLLAECSPGPHQTPPETFFAQSLCKSGKREPAPGTGCNPDEFHLPHSFSPLPTLPLKDSPEARPPQGPHDTRRLHKQVFHPHPLLATQDVLIKQRLCLFHRQEKKRRTRDELQYYVFWLLLSKVSADPFP